jgi:hypothetical protein
MTSDEVEAAARKLDGEANHKAAALLRRMAARIEELEKALARHHWNIEEDGDDLLICDGQHEKSEPCRYVRYSPAPPPAP